MNEPKVAISRQTFRRLLRAICMFLKSPVGGKARWLLVALFLLMFCINGMNVANSFVGRYFMSAIERRDSGGFVHFAWLYVGVFAGSTFIGVMFRFTEERLGLLWRDYLTHRIAGQYIDSRIYLHMSSDDSISNPDQRMTEDVRQLTTSTLSFVLMIINGTMTVLSFFRRIVDHKSHAFRGRRALRACRLGTHHLAGPPVDSAQLSTSRLRGELSFHAHRYPQPRAGNLPRRQGA